MEYQYPFGTCIPSSHCLVRYAINYSEEYTCTSSKLSEAHYGENLASNKGPLNTTNYRSGYFMRHFQCT